MQKLYPLAGKFAHPEHINTNSCRGNSVIVQVLSVATAEESFNGMTHVEVFISDNGEGMPEEMHDKIFELFFTTKIAKLGIGLGLPISKESMEDHGGSISVSSIVGKGFDLFSLFPI